MPARINSNSEHDRSQLAAEEDSPTDFRMPVSPRKANTCQAISIKSITCFLSPGDNLIYHKSLV